SGPPLKPWERAGSSSGPAPFKPASAGSTSDVVEALGTTIPSEIVPTNNTISVGSRARELYKAGLHTPQAIVETSIPEIAKTIFESASWDAQDLSHYG
nr:peroxisomal membrane protein 13 [Tanacetum cinerariifolium]